MPRKKRGGTSFGITNILNINKTIKNDLKKTAEPQEVEMIDAAAELTGGDTQTTAEDSSPKEADGDKEGEKIVEEVFFNCLKICLIY